MKSTGETLFVLATQFAIMSLFAIGGANAAIPEMHRLAVEVMGWMDDRQFADLFGIAQLTPGPNVIIVALIGYQAAGLPGAVVATSAICGPTCILAYWMGKTWDRFKTARWRIAIQNGLIPVSLGMIAASAFVIARAADTGLVTTLLTALGAAVAYWTRITPLWLFALAAILGACGLI